MEVGNEDSRRGEPKGALDEGKIRREDEKGQGLRAAEDFVIISGIFFSITLG